VVRNYSVVVRNYSIGRDDASWIVYGIVLVQVIRRLTADLVALAALVLRPRLATSAENLVPRRQLALFK